MTKNTDILHDVCDQLGGWEDSTALGRTAHYIAECAASQHTWLFGRINSNRAVKDEATAQELALGNINQAEADHRLSVDEITLTRAEVDAVLFAMRGASYGLSATAKLLDQMEKHLTRTENSVDVIAAMVGSLCQEEDGSHVIQ